jgi:hypothetical protein
VHVKAEVARLRTKVLGKTAGPRTHAVAKLRNPLLRDAGLADRFTARQLPAGPAVRGFSQPILGR